MPKMGESVAEATIIKWVKNVGDMIEADETVVEIATDKVDSEIPSTTKGQLIKKLYNENDVVSVGETIAIIDDGKESDKDTNRNNSTDVSFISYNKDVFNNAFENQEIDAQHMQLMKIAEPEPMAISNRLNYTELGGSRPNDL